MKVEFNTKYNIGDTVTYTEGSHDVTCRKVVILKVSTYCRSDCGDPAVLYYVHRYEDKGDLYDEWVPESALSDQHA